MPLVLARTYIHYEKNKLLWGDNFVIIQVMVYLWLFCTPLTANYLWTKFHFNPVCNFQDMARTYIQYDKYKVKGR